MTGGERHRGGSGRHRHDGSRDRGLSLIELVVAMAVFALVASLGLQSLSGMLHQRDRLTDLDDQTAALSRGLGLLRNDLAAVLPLAFYPPDRAAPRSAIAGDSATTLSLSLGGQPDLSGGDTRQRVVWRLDPQSEVLMRRIWVTLTPADRSALRPEVPVLEGVKALRLRSFWRGQGWVSGLSNPLGNASLPEGGPDTDAPATAELYSDTLPEALEITLIRSDGGDITLIESFR